MAIQRVDATDEFSGLAAGVFFPVFSRFVEGPFSSLSHSLNGLSFTPGEWTHSDFRIVWPMEGGRCRRVLSRSGIRRRYVVPGYRHGRREIHCEATEERDVAIVLDASPGILFQEQPALINFLWRGSFYDHYPDFSVLTCKGLEFWECKGDEEAQSLAVRARTAHLQTILARAGLGYRLITAKMLSSMQFLCSASLIRRCHDTALEKVQEDRVCEIAGRRPVRIESILGILDRRGEREGELLRALFGMIYRGSLRFDMNHRLDRFSEVRYAGGRVEVPWLLSRLDQTS